MKRTIIMRDKDLIAFLNKEKKNPLFSTIEVEPLTYKELQEETKYYFSRFWDKENDSSKEPKSYYQVFSDRHGFQKDLSAIDLLFNTGPEARSFL